MHNVLWVLENTKWCKLDTSSVMNPESSVFQVLTHQTPSLVQPSQSAACGQVVHYTKDHLS